MTILIAQNTLNIGAEATTISPVQTIGKLVEMGAGAVLVIGALAVLMYLLLGAINWLTAGGDKGKVETGKSMITNAIIGLAILASVFAVFSLLLGFFGIRDRISLSGIGGGNGGGGGSSQQCSTGMIYCAGCIRGCRPNTRTCNAWIDAECDIGGTCAGQGVYANGRPCCTPLVLYGNGRCDMP